MSAPCSGSGRRTTVIPSWRNRSRTSATVGARPSRWCEVTSRPGTAKGKHGGGLQPGIPGRAADRDAARGAKPHRPARYHPRVACCVPPRPPSTPSGVDWGAADGTLLWIGELCKFRAAEPAVETVRDSVWWSMTAVGTAAACRGELEAPDPVCAYACSLVSFRPVRRLSRSERYRLPRPTG